MRIESAGAAVLTIAILGTANGHSAHQGLAPRLADEQVLREYTGVYRWDDNAVVYLQMWNEFSGFDKPSQLVAFDESGDVRGPQGRWSPRLHPHRVAERQPSAVRGKSREQRRDAFAAAHRSGIFLDGSGMARENDPRPRRDRGSVTASIPVQESAV